MASHTNLSRPSLQTEKTQSINPAEAKLCPTFFTISSSHFSDRHSIKEGYDCISITAIAICNIHKIESDLAFSFPFSIKPNTGRLIPLLMTVVSVVDKKSQCKDMDFSLVCKAHAVSATFFGLVFLVASFGWSLPIIGPEALLAGWDMDNAAFAYLIRFTSGVMFGFGMMEWVFAEQEKMKDIFVIYHAISAVLFCIRPWRLLRIGWVGFTPF